MTEAKRSVHVVFGTRTSTETGAQLSRQIIGAFEDAESAERLEQAFNQAQRATAEDAIVGAFTTRYSFPYVASSVADVLPRGTVQVQEKAADTHEIHVVITTTTNTETGAQVFRQIIGILEDEEAADTLERSFNLRKHKEGRSKVEAFGLRFALPYAAWTET